VLNELEAMLEMNFIYFEAPCCERWPDASTASL
jgi:hypothetical protein